MITSTIIYLLIFTVTSFLSEISIRLRKKSRNEILFFLLIIFLICLVPAIFAGIRYDVGTDFFNYTRIFHQINSGLFVQTEPFYTILNRLVGLLGGNINTVFFIINFLTVLFIYIFLYDYKESISVGLGMFIFLVVFYNSSLNIIRQILSMSVVLYSYKYIDSNKMIKFLLFSLLAISIHKTAVVTLPIYFVYNYFAEKKLVNKILIYIIATLLVINYEAVIKFIALEVLRDPYYLMYLEGSSENLVDVGFGIFLIFIPPIMIGIFFYKVLKNKNKSFEFYFFLLIIGFILRLIAYTGIPYLGRIGNFFYIAIVWLVPYYFRVISKLKKYFWIVYLLIMIMILTWFIVYILSGGDGTMPYRTIFN